MAALLSAVLFVSGAASECTIGALGFAIVVGSFSLPGGIAPWLRPLAEMPVALDVARLAIAFGLLLVPATAMGFTLPLLVRVLFERRPNFGAALGRLYGWNTIGAVCRRRRWGRVLDQEVRRGRRGCGSRLVQRSRRVRGHRDGPARGAA